ncbi:MAG: hypothetical protein Aurels2KO_48260 [Aureliella sp.]
MPRLEKRIPLGLAIEQYYGKSVHRKTAIRWVRHGADGVRLEAELIAGCWHSSVEAVQRFTSARTKAKLAGTTSQPTSQEPVAKSSIWAVHQKLAGGHA